MRREQMERPQHVSVLLEESLEFLAVRPSGVYADLTLGLGGHSAEIARRLGAKGKLIAFDRDPEAMSKAQAGHADGSAQRADGRTSGKSGGRRRTRQPDLRIRRGKEVAENRQSYCAGAADNDNSRTRSSRFGLRPANKRREDSPGDQDLSSTPNSCERRIAGDPIAAQKRGITAQAGWKAGADQLPLSRGPAGKGCAARRREGRPV